MNPLEYVKTPVPQSGVMNFSPSQFSKFIMSPHNWYRSEILGEEGFTHNTSSVIGTCVHYCAEQVAKGEIVDENAINEYIDSLEESEDYSRQEVKDNFRSMAETLVNDYVLKNDFLHIEKLVQAPVKKGYYAGGKIDAIQGSKEECMIVDYKTYNSKTKPRAIPQHYRYQLLVYAWVLRAMGYNPTRIRLVYINRYIEGEISQKTGKRMKSYPPEITQLTEQIEDTDFDFIEGLLDLAVDTVETSKAHPELNHVIWHDPRLKVA